MSMFSLTTASFDETVLHSAEPVLVEFSAPWCGYCRRLAPVLDRMKDEPGIPAIGTVDIDNEPSLAQRFHIDTIPALLLFRSGQHGEALIAPGTAAQIKTWLAEQGV